MLAFLFQTRKAQNKPVLSSLFSILIVALVIFVIVVIVFFTIAVLGIFVVFVVFGFIIGFVFGFALAFTLGTVLGIALASWHSRRLCIKMHNAMHYGFSILLISNTNSFALSSEVWA